MNKKQHLFSEKIIITLFFVLASLLANAKKYSSLTDTTENKQSTSTHLYEKSWEQVDSLNSRGFTKSALSITKNIYQRAKTDNNAVQIIKAIIYQIKLHSNMEENSLQKSIGRVKQEITDSEYPLRPILHSVLAELYWSYYQANRWKIQNRTPIISYTPNDISTWDMKTIVAHIVTQYTLSLQEFDLLQKTPVDIYDDILVQERDTAKEKTWNSHKFRPTLYDFLAHRAIDFYKNEEPGLIRPAKHFQLNSKRLFDDYNTFYQLNLHYLVIKDDTLDFKYLALQLLQNLIQFHAVLPEGKEKNRDVTELIDVDLERLQFVWKNSIGTTVNDSLYLLALQNLEEKFSAYPASSEIAYAMATVYINRGENYDPLSSDKHKWAKKTALAICENTIRKFPDSFGSEQCKSLADGIKNKFFAFKLENVNLPGQPFRGRVSYTNMNKVFIRIINNKNKKQEKYSRNEAEMIDSFMKEKIIKEFSISLPSDEDYQPHATEIKIPALDAGSYIMLIGSDTNFSYQKNAITYSTFTISRLSFIAQRTQDNDYEVLVMDRKTGKPMQGVQAQLWTNSYNAKAQEYEYIKSVSYMTDKKGSIAIPSTIADAYHSNYSLELSYNGDTLFTPNCIYLYQHTASATQKKQIRTFFFTDRSIYRPGQTLFFKGIMLEKKGGDTSIILTHKNTTVSLMDVNGKMMSKLNLTTNEYGSFAGSFTLPQQSLTGKMHVENESGSVYFSVEEYKRPIFEVTFSPLNGSYKLNKDLSISGKAQSYAGVAISHAQVKYRVVRKTSYPYYLSYRMFLSSPPAEISNGITTTNDTGGFTINFHATPDLNVSKKYFPTFTYSVQAEVTDITGETQPAQTNVSVGYNALVLQADMSDKVLKDTIHTININTTNLNGVFQPSHVTVKIWKQEGPSHLFRDRLWTLADKHTISKEEYYSAFPHDLYEEENNSKQWGKTELIYSGEIDTKKDNRSLNLHAMKRWSNGAYMMELKTKDAFGEDIDNVQYFTLYSMHSSTIPLQQYDWFVPLTTTAEPGEKAGFLIGTGDKDVNVFYEIEHRNKVIKREWITLHNEQRKIEIPIKEQYRGGISVYVVFIKDNSVYQHRMNVAVPFSNKALKVEYESFRNKLQPGQKEEWKIKIKNATGGKVSAELLASMYDASLDAFVPHPWNFDIHSVYRPFINWNADRFISIHSSLLLSNDWNTFYPIPIKTYNQLNWFGCQYIGISHARVYGPNASVTAGAGGTTSIATDSGIALQEKLSEGEQGNYSGEGTKKGSSGTVPDIIPRKNLNETAFFFPQLQTDPNGNIIIQFTSPEALTRWNFMGLAHTKDLQYTLFNKEVVTQKELMITPHAPRFFRGGDKIIFTAKVDNLSSENLKGNAQLFLYDAISSKDITSTLMQNKISATQSFTVHKSQSTTPEWKLTIPEGINAITYKVLAQAGNFTDGEESSILVLNNKMLVTESLPLYIQGNETSTFKFDKLISQNGGSTTPHNLKLTLEFSSNPAWYAIQALPYMMESPYSSSEQIFSRFYANSIAANIVKFSPKIKTVFDAWKLASPETFLSNLEKNQELKSIVLEETPWMLDAKDESERKKRVALLFDFNKMTNELDAALSKLIKMQASNGSWPWFEGMQDDRYITQHIVSGMGHLDHLEIKSVRSNPETWNMINKAVHYMDNKIHQDYEHILNTEKGKMNEDQISQLQIQYLYARSYFKDIAVETKNQKAFEYYKEQAKKYWMNKNRYMQGMIALSLFRMEDKNTPKNILKSLQENAIVSKEMGMYWKENYKGVHWYNAPVESQALLIEAFDEISNDSKTVDNLKTWLLRSKQTQHWASTKATTEAIYALLLRGTDWLSTEPKVEIYVGDVKINTAQTPELQAEAGTGYFKTSWNGNEIKPNMGNIIVTKKDKGVSWGCIYWQYFEKLDKITPPTTPLQLNKKLFLEHNTVSGPVLTPVTDTTILHPGDKLTVRLELRVDRSMEYVHIKDLRASGFEPVNVLSSYKYQDGLSYYESTRDASTDFFISSLPKGTYVFEYPLIVSHKGDFSNGIATIACMYAPEFRSHSRGIKVKVEE